MRVVYVSYMHPMIAPGGAQQVAMELFRASLESGDDAYLITALEANHEEQYGKPGAAIVPMHGEDRQYVYFPQFYDFLHLSIADWRGVGLFADLIRKIDPDVIHFHHYHRIGVESIRAARVAVPNAVISLTFHEMMAICLADGQMVKTHNRELCHAARPIDCGKCFPHLRPEFFTLRAERLKAMLAECDRYMFPSSFLAERYVDWGLDPEKCVVVQNGQVNKGTGYDPSTHSTGVNVFGFFGQFIDNKGVDVVLDALLILIREGRVPPGGIVFEINGGNTHYASEAYLAKIKGLVEEITKLGARNIRIVDKGQYSRDELADRMRSVDWVVVPSTWWEVFGLVVSEAWMFGRPVIASAIAGLGERVRHGENGYVFRSRDSRGLGNLMASLAGNPSRWAAANAGIVKPWTEFEMLDAYKDVWAEIKPVAAEAIPGLVDSMPSAPALEHEVLGPDVWETTAGSAQGSADALAVSAPAIEGSSAASWLLPARARVDSTDGTRSDDLAVDTAPGGEQPPIDSQTAGAASDAAMDKVSTRPRRSGKRRAPVG